MQKKILSIFIIVVCTLAVSCKLPSPKDHIDKTTKHRPPLAVGQVMDILNYKIKEEHHQKDSLGLRFQKILLEKIAPFEYQLHIEATTEPSKVQFHEGYYIILFLYPEDDQIGFLKPERIKYGFESYSAKIKQGEKNQLVIDRNIITKLTFARAITVSVIEYDNNQKSQVLVMQNVTL